MDNIRNDICINLQSRIKQMNHRPLTVKVHLLYNSSSCGLCVKLCPVNNSELVKYPEFLNNCFLYLRCFAYCPKEAINFKNYCSTSYRAVVVDEFLI